MTDDFDTIGSSTGRIITKDSPITQVDHIRLSVTINGTKYTKQKPYGDGRLSALRYNLRRWLGWDGCSQYDPRCRVRRREWQKGETIYSYEFCNRHRFLLSAGKMEVKA